MQTAAGLIFRELGLVFIFPLGVGGSMVVSWVIRFFWNGHLL